jgi:hypothetical protein
LNIATAVDQIASSSDFAIEGLQTGCLNMAAYAETILEQVEILTRKPVKKASVVVALSRLAKTYIRGNPQLADFRLHNIVSRTGLSELTYTKTPHVQSHIANLHKQTAVQNAPFFIAMVGLTEVSFITSKALVEFIQEGFSDVEPTLRVEALSSLTIQTDSSTIDTPRQSYTIIKQLALRDITIVEYVTSPSELTIILYDKNLKESFNILHDRFFKQ